MRHLSLFAGSGIGTLAAQSAGIVTVAHAESDPACCYCLERLWPDARLFRDVRDVTAESLADLAPIDIVSGGFPCQDVSTAGKGAGLGDEATPTRSGLWYEFARVIREVRPAWCLIENVPALRVRGGDRVCADLESMAYTWEAVVVGAWAVGAPHKRDRVWIVAHRPRERREQRAEWDGTGECGELVDAIAPRREGQRRGRCPSGVLGGNGQGGAAERDLLPPENAGPVLDHTNATRRGARPAVGEAGDGPGTPGEVPAIRCEAVADSNQIGCRQERLGYTEARKSRGLCRFPARPGEPRHAWEAPRLAQFGVGDATDGVARRVRSRANKAALRMVGNAWCYPVAEMLFRAIVELAAVAEQLEAREP